MAVVKNRRGLLDHGTLKSTVSQKSELIKWADFLACWYKVRKGNVNLVIVGWAWSKMDMKFRSYGTLIQYFLVWPPIYSVTLTFSGCPLQFYLLKMMFCSSAHRKISFRTWFFQMFFNKSLIKCEKFVSCLMQHSKNIENYQKPISLSCIATEPHNFKILLFLLHGYHHTL